MLFLYGGYIRTENCAHLKVKLYVHKRGRNANESMHYIPSMYWNTMNARKCMKMPLNTVQCSRKNAAHGTFSVSTGMSCSCCARVWKCIYMYPGTQTHTHRWRGSEEGRRALFAATLYIVTLGARSSHPFCVCAHQMVRAYVSIHQDLWAAIFVM